MPDQMKANEVINFRLNLRALEILWRAAVEKDCRGCVLTSDGEELKRFILGAETVFLATGYMTDLEIRQTHRVLSTPLIGREH